MSDADCTPVREPRSVVASLLRCMNRLLSPCGTKSDVAFTAPGTTRAATARGHLQNVTNCGTKKREHKPAVS